MQNNLKIKRIKSGCSLLTVGSALLIQLGCGGSSPRAPASQPSSSDGTIMLTERQSMPASEMESMFSAKLDQVFGGKNAQIKDKYLVNIVANGAFVSKKESFLVCSEEPASVPSSGLSPSELEDVRYFVETYFAPSDKKFVITASDNLIPSAAINVIVAQKLTDIGCGNSNAKIKYLAPNDSADMSQKDVVFVFRGAVQDISDLVTQVENAIESAAGIENIGGTLQPASSDATLQNTTEINSFSRLLLELDSEKVADITPLKPELNKLIPGGARYIDEFDRVLSVSIAVGSQEKGSSSSGSGNNNSSNAGSNLMGWLSGLLGGGGSFGGGLGSNGSSGNSTQPADLISAFGSLSGYPQMAIAAQILGGILNSKGSNSNSGSLEENKSYLPDYTDVVGINEYTDVGTLCASLDLHHDFVVKNYDKQTVKELESLLVVAYSQRFRAIQVNSALK